MNRIRELREQYNLTQKALGELMGYSESTCSLYESGKRQPDTKTLIFLANFFHVSIDYILGRSDEKTADQMDGGADEAEMLRLFRRLSPEKKEYLRGVLEGLTADRKR